MVILILLVSGSIQTENLISKGQIRERKGKIAGEYIFVFVWEQNFARIRWTTMK